MARLGALFCMGAACFPHQAGALRAREQGRSGPAHEFTGFAQEALHFSAAPKTPDWGKALGGALEWAKKQGEAAKAKAQEQSSQPKPADAAKQGLDRFLGWMQQQQQPKAASTTAARGVQQPAPLQPKPNAAAGSSLLDGLFGIIKQKQQQQQQVASTTAAPAVQQPKVAPASSPLDGLMGIIKQQHQKQVASTTAAPAVQQPAPPQPKPNAAPGKSPLDDIFGIIKQQQQKQAASTTKAPAVQQPKAAPTSSPLDGLMGIIRQQHQKQAAPPPQAAAPKSPLEGIADWFKSQQQKATASTAEAVTKAAKQSAHGSLDDFLKWAKSQGEKAAHAAGEVAAKRASQEKADVPTGEQAKSTGEKSMAEAEEKARDAMKQLVDQAKSTAMETAKEEAPKVIEQTVAAQEHAKAKRKASVDHSIEEAEKHLKAADAAAAKADSAAKGAAEKAAQEASQRALADLLAWASADASTDKSIAATGDPVFDAEVIAEKVMEEASVTGSMAQSVDEIAHQAEVVQQKGHDRAKALWKAGLPFATSSALKAAQDAARKANLTIHRSDLIGHIADYTKYMVKKCVEAAMQTTNPKDFKNAWGEVMRAYGAAGEAEEDARWALKNSRDASLAVAASIAEVGWRAVSETLRSEVTLFLTVARKAAKAKEQARFNAWLEGIASAKPVAQAAFLKGFSKGLQAVAGKNVVGKVKKATDSAAHASIAWSQAITKVMASQEARRAVSKASQSATKAAAAAAAAAAGTTFQGLKHAIDGAAKVARRLAQPGSNVVTSGSWSFDKGYRGDVHGSYGGARFGAHVTLHPNRTHERLFLSGHAGVPFRSEVKGMAVAAQGKKPQYPSVSKFTVLGGSVFGPDAGAQGSTRAEPLGKSAEHIIQTGAAWAGPRSAKTLLDAVVTSDGRFGGKASGEAKIPELQKPMTVKYNFVQPLPR